MRAATLEEHYWRLQSGEERHALHPETFWLPDLSARQQLQRGQAARLLFELEGDGENGVERAVERMSVIVAERVGHGYIGILDDQPHSLLPGPHVYLAEGVEIPFWPEHVIGIAEPPAEWVAHRLGQPRRDFGRARTTGQLRAPSCGLTNAQADKGAIDCSRLRRELLFDSFAA